MDREEGSSHILGRYHGLDREEDSSHMLGRYHGQRGGQ